MSVPIPVERAAVATGEVAAPVGSKVTGTVNGAKESNCVEWVLLLKGQGCIIQNSGC